MANIVSFVGKSGSGKTTLLEKIIPVLSKAGYRVAAIKHVGHHFNLDQEEKDSWRLMEAGADCVAIGANDRIAVIRSVEQGNSLDNILSVLGNDYDIILVEGYKTSKIPKIEVYDSRLASELSCPEDQLIAVISDADLGVAVPIFRRKDINGIVKFITGKIVRPVKDKLALFVDGKRVPLNPFLVEFMSNTVSGMLSSLKGVDNPSSAQIWLRTGPGEKHDI